MVLSPASETRPGKADRTMATVLKGSRWVVADRSVWVVAEVGRGYVRLCLESDPAVHFRTSAAHVLRTYVPARELVHIL
jgi:hypothetical protein